MVALIAERERSRGGENRSDFGLTDHALPIALDLHFPTPSHHVIPGLRGPPVYPVQEPDRLRSKEIGSPLEAGKA